MSKIRVRFAPSPTGYLHLGGARTALFNWLYARNQDGIFILRIEDTDKSRSTEEATQHILAGLKWIGLTWDEGPFFQTDRLKIYQESADKLLTEGKAYRCFCTPQDLEAERKNAQLRNEAPKYSGRCRTLETAGSGPSVLRFKMPAGGKTVVQDIIRGEVEFENNLLDDFVIMKSDGFPTYNFAAVVDDYLMNISHVIRGDDHLSNTPRQIQLYLALGLKPPKFAHIPMILGSDKTRLSKRHGATSLIEYKNLGYLPGAMLNYLARLGWGCGDQEIFTKDELIRKFSLKKVVKTPATFDLPKLNWINGTHIRKTPVEKLVPLTKPFLEKTYPDKPLANLEKIVASLHDRMETLAQIVELSDFFFVDEVKYDESAVSKYLKKEGISAILSKLAERLETLHNFNKDEIEKVFRNLAAELNLAAADVIHPARVALTGRAESPPMFEVVEILGREKSTHRLRKATGS